VTRAQTSGQIALKVGPITSAVDQVNIVLNGTGGHTSRPQLTQDVIGALGALGDHDAAVAVSPDRPAQRRFADVGIHAFRFGRQRHSADRRDCGTLRALDADGWHAAKQLIPNWPRRSSDRSGSRWTVAVTDGVPPAVNHARGVRRLTRAAEQILGPDAVTITEQSLGGEDFSWMLQRSGCPGAARGENSGALCPDIHQPTFVVDEACIPVGFKVLAEVATTYERTAI
jgi:amidohydrolase